jgi:acyl-CoA reductase-like NAD-dependent aldehyde dehydrogenase
MTIQLNNIIGGKQESVRAVMPFHNPATGANLGTAPRSSEADVNRAVRAAAEARLGWRDTVPRQRALLRLADLVEEHADNFLDAEVFNTGKPRAVHVS